MKIPKAHFQDLFLENPWYSSHWWLALGSVPNPRGLSLQRPWRDSPSRPDPVSSKDSKKMSQSQPKKCLPQPATTKNLSRNQRGDRFGGSFYSGFLVFLLSFTDQAPGVAPQRSRMRLNACSARPGVTTWMSFMGQSVVPESYPRMSQHEKLIFQLQPGHSSIHVLEKNRTFSEGEREGHYFLLLLQPPILLFEHRTFSSSISHAWSHDRAWRLKAILARPGLPWVVHPACLVFFPR